jgi:hypothetical protein
MIDVCGPRDAKPGGGIACVECKGRVWLPFVEFGGSYKDSLEGSLPHPQNPTLLTLPCTLHTNNNNNRNTHLHGAIRRSVCSCDTEAATAATATSTMRRHTAHEQACKGGAQGSDVAWASGCSTTSPDPHTCTQRR